jgi:hypothetical protein
MIETLNETRLAPAVVREVRGASVLALADGVEVEAQNALAFPYSPKAHDVVLLISQSERHYIIGVLETRGDAALQFPANLRIHAKGSVQLSSGEGVELHGPEVKVTAGKWEVVARTLKERVHHATRWVKGLATLRAGRRTVKVEGANVERAESHLLRAKKDVRVNGDKIHLG